MLTVLEVCLCKPAIHKLKIFSGEKFEYYKSMGEPQKGGNQILKVQLGEEKRGITIFNVNLVGRKTLEEITILDKRLETH